MSLASASRFVPGPEKAGDRHCKPRGMSSHFRMRRDKGLSLSRALSLMASKKAGNERRGACGRAGRRAPWMHESPA
eukprot:3121541-Pleurochrysis_carterae.AAC.1